MKLWCFGDSNTYECFAACFGGGIGPAIMDALSVEDMSPDELIKAARLRGVDISGFER